MSTTRLAAFRQWLLDELLVMPASADLYVTDVRIALDYAGGPVAFLRDGGDGRAPKTLQHYLAALRNWAQFTEDGALTKKLGKRMARLLPEPTVKTPKYPLDLAAWRAFTKELVAADYVDDVLRGVIGFMAYRGVRVADVLRLERRVAREALAQSSFYLSTKKHKRLEIETSDVAPFLRAFLEVPGWKRVEDLISEDSAPERRRRSAAHRVYRAVKRVAEGAGLDAAKVHPHRLRRTYAAHFLAQEGVDVEELMHQMGWASVKVALEYVQQRDRTHLKRAAKALRTALDRE